MSSDVPIPEYPSELKHIKVISPEDRAKAEILVLKMENIRYQLQLLQNDAIRAAQTKDALVQEMNAFRAQFQNKYGVDLATLNIAADGTYTIAPVQK
jgi:hypothetical protein